MKKLAAALLGLLVVGAVAAPLLLRRLLPPEKVQELVVTGARKGLKREVKLDGVDLGVLRGLELRGLKIAEGPDFSKGTFASVESFGVRVRLLPLLSKKVVVDSVSASGVVLKIHKRADGTYNFSDLLAAGPAKGGGKPSAAAGSDVEVAVSGVKLDRVSVEYSEAGGAREVALTDLTARVSGFKPAGAFSAEASGKATGRWDGKDLSGEASYAGTLDLGGQEPERFSAHAKKLVFSVSGWTVELSGDLKDLSKPAADVAFAVAGPRGRLAEGKFKGTVTPPGGKGQLAADGALTVKTAELKGEDAALLKLPEGAVVPELAVASDFGYSGDALGFKSLDVKGPFGSVKASGRAGKLSSGSPDLDLDFDVDLDVPELPAGTLAWAKLPPAFVSPAFKARGKGRLKGDDASFSGMTVEGKAGKLEVTGGVRGLRSGAPVPDLDLSAKLEFGPLKSADDPFGKAPPGWELPASKWEAAVNVGKDDAKIKGLRIVIGKNDLEVADGGRVVGYRSEAPLVNLLLKCRSFQLEELTAVTPETRDMGLAGSGFFALQLTGKLPRPVTEGKAQFKGVGFTLGGLDFKEFTGTASFNETRIDVPNLAGKIGDGDLAMNLTLKNYAKEPDIDLESSLTRFDLGKFLSARAALAAKRGKPAPGSEAAATEAAGESKPPPIAFKGKFNVGELAHPNVHAKDIRLSWELERITPDLKQISGQAKLYSAGGDFKDLSALASQGKAFKVLLLPVMIFQKVSRIGIIPDLNNVSYSALTGDYGFASGIMTLNDSRISTSAGEGVATGRINLPGEALDLLLNFRPSTLLPPIDIPVTGTFDEPKAKPKVLKALVEGLFKK